MCHPGLDHAPPFRPRGAVSTVFFINGAVLASWVPHIPAVKARHAIGDGQLGLVLLCMALGAVLALPLAGWLVDRFGSRIMTSVAAVGFCLALPLPVISPNLAVLSLALALLGACNGTLDVSMNAQAIVVERQYRRPIMSSFHGLFSLGGVVGAGTAGLAMSLGVGDSQHVALTALVSVCGMGWSLRWLAPSSPADQRSDPVFARPTGRLLGLGLLAFAGLLAEGAMADWSAVYLHDALKSSPAVAAAGFAVFSLTMRSFGACCWRWRWVIFPLRTDERRRLPSFGADRVLSGGLHRDVERRDPPGGVSREASLLGPHRGNAPHHLGDVARRWARVGGDRADGGAREGEAARGRDRDCHSSGPRRLTALGRRDQAIPELGQPGLSGHAWLSARLAGLHAGP